MNSDDLGALLPLVLLLAVAYFLMIRPARRRARETADLQAALSIGDDVMTTSGIFGRVVGSGDEFVELEVAPGLVLKMHRGAVGKILTGTPATDAATGEAVADPGSEVAGGADPATADDSTETTEPSPDDDGTRGAR